MPALALTILLAAATLAPPLAAARPHNSKADAEPVIDAQALQPRLAQFYAHFVTLVSASTDREQVATANLTQLRRLTLAKLSAMRACRTTLFQDNPRDALIDTWGLCISFRLLLESPAGQDRFGPEAPTMLAGLKLLLAEIETIAAEFLTPAQIAETAQAMETYFSRHEAVTAMSLDPPAAGELASGAGLGWLFRLPLAPFRAMEGVDSTAEALGSLSATADNFMQMAASMPLEISWQSELLMLQVREDSNYVLQQTLDEVDDRARVLIDLVFLRSLQLLGAILGATLLYQLLITRLRRSSPSRP